MKLKIIISPAKKMHTGTGTYPDITVPVFHKEARIIADHMKTLSYEQLKKLWKCNDALISLNSERLQNMNLSAGQTPAVLAYEGIQYQYMKADNMGQQELTYLQEHLCILSGLYGVLRPMDGIVSYRLEMQSRVPDFINATLYEYWGSRLAEKICETEPEVILNLASKEYSKSILPHIPQGVLVKQCMFAELIEGKLVEKSTFAKMARGEMVRYMAGCQADSLEQVRDFHEMGYTYSEKFSSNETIVFLKQAKRE